MKQKTHYNFGASQKILIIKTVKRSHETPAFGFHDFFLLVHYRYFYKSSNKTHPLFFLES